MVKKEYGVYAVSFGMYDEFHAIVKLGETGNLDRRNEQHISKTGNAFTRGREAKTLLWCPVSQYNTKRYEDKNRAIWDNLPGFQRAFHCRDTFLVDVREVQEISLTIRKTYTAVLCD